MPTIFVFKNVKERDIIILIKESSIVPEVFEMLKVRLHNIIQFEDRYTREELVVTIEDTIEEYGGTLIPFTAYIMEY